MSMIPIGTKDYSDGRTKQSFKDSTDINKILKKAQRAGGLAHVMKYPAAVYGEFENIDLLEAQERLARAGEIFADLPSEVRSEFDNDPISFVSFAADPKNNDKLVELLPAIAEPGTYFPNPVKTGGQGAGAATAPAEPEGPGEGGPPIEPPRASEGVT